jgi:SNW domain-containing protein 1
MQQLLAQKEKTQKEENLRLLAQRAREERAGITPSVAASSSAPPRETGMGLGGYGSDSEEESDEEQESEEDEEAIREREQVRAEKRREREKELRMSNMGSEMRAKLLAR